jgi:starch synthase
MKILFVAAEGLPFSKTGGLADVIEALPKSLTSLGHEVAVLLPRYRNSKTVGPPKPSVAIPMGDAVRYPAIADGGALSGVHYYLLDDPEYFDRDQLYGIAGKDYPDNPERFTEFSRAAIEFSKHFWMPDVIHCHDWQAAMVPALLKTEYATDPEVKGLPVIFTIHNMGYQGVFPRETLGKLGIPANLFRMDALEFYGQLNFLKGALIYSDYLTTVSRKYAQEIQTPEYGCGLDGVVRDRAARLTGILNGVDYTAWDPAADRLIPARYSPKKMSGKKMCKENLLIQFDLPPESANWPLIGIVSRFAGQKGFDLILEAAPELLAEDVSIIALGAGEPVYERRLRDLANQFPNKMKLKIAYDNALAHKIEAGADIFLMPSRYEPCGLNQIYSLKYGTVPVVRATGGLDDTIEPFDPASGIGTGFKFEPYESKAMLGSIRQALATYRDKASWRKIQSNGMACNFSWAVAAEEYERLYENAVNARIKAASGASN